MPTAKRLRCGFSLRMWPIALFAAALVLVGGCGDKHGRQSLAGTVTFQGEPLERGFIEFLPVSAGEAPSSAAIVDGKYRIPAEHGVNPGEYQVKIYKTVGPSDAPAGPLPPPGAERSKRSPAKARPTIQPEYNTRSKLRVEVTTGKNQFDYDIE